jgi:hypothetical protein
MKHETLDTPACNYEILDFKHVKLLQACTFHQL